MIPPTMLSISPLDFVLPRRALAGRCALDYADNGQDSGDWRKLCRPRRGTSFAVNCPLMPRSYPVKRLSTDTTEKKKERITTLFSVNKK